ncbi:VOC family protein [Kribbella solani]|uniref:VOC family protein n=1 Tax=Kribbella solani TaxID=236067 RepID=UPI0029B005EB|nr:VOC family protein [Kribbella solani]MDX2970822.1 VOC family protein [Kribbella solani]MDX3006345.1 VOC family protein [Kribbella solani]
MIISLPIADRPRSYVFYQEALDLKPVGEELDEDGIPEPLQFALADGVNLMLIPTGGFGWVLGDQPAAPPGQSECILSLHVESTDAVDALVAKAVAAGAVQVTAPTRKPWAYLATFTDPDGHLWMVETA